MRANLQPCQFQPVLAPPIDDQTDRWPARYITDSKQLARGDGLRFLVEWRVDPLPPTTAKQTGTTCGVPDASTVAMRATRAASRNASSAALTLAGRLSLIAYNDVTCSVRRRQLKIRPSRTVYNLTP